MSISFKNHPALIASQDVAEICKPLKNISVDFFCYHKVDSDWSEIMLSNSMSWATYFYKKNFSLYSEFKNLLGPNFQYVIWPCSKENAAMDIVRDMCALFYGITLIFRNKNGYECYGFALSKKNSQINLILNNIELLRRFCSYFKEQAQQIITRCKNHKIIPIERKIILDSDSSINFDREKFLNETKINRLLDKTRLSDRELDCANYLILGKTAAETAASLNISRRTVETYLTNIKNKFGCQTKSELISYLIKIGFVPSTDFLS